MVLSYSPVHCICSVLGDLLVNRHSRKRRLGVVARSQRAQNEWLGERIVHVHIRNMWWIRGESARGTGQQLSKRRQVTRHGERMGRQAVNYVRKQNANVHWWTTVEIAFERRAININEWMVVPPFYSVTSSVSSQATMYTQACFAIARIQHRIHHYLNAN